MEIYIEIYNNIRKYGDIYRNIQKKYIDIYNNIRKYTEI